MYGDTIPDAYAKNTRSYFSEWKDSVYDPLHNFITRNDGFNFLLATATAISLPTTYLLASKGLYKSAATSFLGGTLGTLISMYNYSEIAMLIPAVSWNPLNYFSTEDPPLIYPLDDQDEVISRSIADIALVIPPAARKSGAWISNNIAWYWDTTFNSADNVHLASTLSEGLPFIDIKPVYQGWGHYIYTGLFGDGADKARSWLKTLKALAQGVPDKKTLRIFFSRSLVNGLNLQVLLIEKDDAGNIIESSPRLSVKMEWPENAYSILDEIVAGGYGRGYANESGTKHGEGYTVVSVFDEAILAKLTQVISQFVNDPGLTEFEFEGDSFLPVVTVPKRLNLMALSLARGVWIFDDQRFSDQPDTRELLISFAQQDHWVISPSKSKAENKTDEIIRDNDFNERVIKRVDEQIIYTKSRSPEEWRALVWLASFKLARMTDPLKNLVGTVVPSSTLIHYLNLDSRPM
ncbi:hypothetical protein [Endozoicomonas sp. Mp262]|uniref:hypothetical protein n=1 Tax=Endozoicomonas sp. Mp262 TaxID=2919499 RepID=UPI0021DB6F06